MSVTIRPYRTGGWEVDIHVILPNGTRARSRTRKRTSKSAALRWGLSRERAWLVDRLPKSRKEVPTLAGFAERFVDGYARANREKPSSIAAKEMILRVHLVPRLGARRLDAIRSEDVQRLKQGLGSKAVKTVNNVLTVLNVLLKTAVEWQVISQMPCTIRLLPVPKSSSTTYHDFGNYGRLVKQAQAADARTYIAVLLGGDAGLRCGEMLALEWPDVDLPKRQLCVQRSDWNGHITAPKNGRLRYIPLTVRLATALRAHRHLSSPRVLCQQDGRPLTRKTVQSWMRRVTRRAGITNNGVHVLKHTSCSHLAMRGAPARAIQELAGHQDLSTTQRYMHLSQRLLRARFGCSTKSHTIQ